jgi:uncharacterized membrane protein
MAKKIRVLFAGEGIYSLTKIYKGWDEFAIGKYFEHGHYFIKALESNGFDYDYIPTTKVAEEFPWTADEMKQYDVIAISDVGSSTFLITERCYAGERTPNRLIEMEKYVSRGGGFLMFGGYLSYSGIHGKGMYRRTAVEKLLPVTLEIGDDRVECPEGIIPKVVKKDHPILTGIPEKWGGWFVSYNRLKAKQQATVIAQIEEYENDPFLVAWNYGKGRAVASAADCAHHGATPSFLEWEYTNTYFGNLVKWCAQQI